MHRLSDARVPEATPPLCFHQKWVEEGVTLLVAKRHSHKFQLTLGVPVLKKSLASVALVAGVAIPMAIAAPSHKPAKPKPAKVKTPIAQVEEIRCINKDGHGQLQSKHAGETQFYNSYPAANGYLHDQFKTDAQTVAALHFTLGGEDGINKDSVVEVVSDRSVSGGKDPSRLLLRKGGIWANISHEKDTKMQIQTNGGVMGIKGTEFVIEADESGATDISVINGEVSWQPNGAKEPVAIKAGQERKFNGPQIVTQLDLTPAEMEKKMRREESWRQFNDALSWGEWFAVHFPHPGAAVTAMEQVRLAGAMAKDPEGFGRGEADARTGGLFSKVAGPPAQDFPILLNPDFLAPPGSKEHPDRVGPTPHFKWRGSKGGHRYQVQVGSDKDLKNVEWAVNTDKTEVDFDPGARPLVPGPHFWAVVPIDDKGNRQEGKSASQATIDVTP